MLKRALIYGGLIALLGAVMTFATSAMGLEGDENASRITGLVSLLLPVIGIVLAIRAAKSADPGPFSFGEGFKQGALVTLVAAVLSAVFAYLYFTAINPDALDTIRETAAAQLREQGFTGRELESAERAQAAMTNPGALTGLGFLSTLIPGLIISAIAAAVMRRKERPAGDGFGGDGYGTPA